MIRLTIICPHCWHAWHDPGWALCCQSAQPCPACGEPVDVMELCQEQVAREIRRGCQGQVWGLIQAGWTFVAPDRDLEPWQWRWRRRPKRPGKPGRLYASTGQAWGALMRERGAISVKG